MSASQYLIFQSSMACVCSESEAKHEKRFFFFSIMKPSTGLCSSCAPCFKSLSNPDVNSTWLITSVTDARLSAAAETQPKAASLARRKPSLGPVQRPVKTPRVASHAYISPIHFHQFSSCCLVSPVRGAGRAGRGGFASRGGPRSHGRTNGTAADSKPPVSLDEQGELGQLKKQYMTELVTLKELFSDWTDDDLVFALQETDGDLETTIERISEGHVSRFADVVKPREKSRAPKETAATTTEKGASGSVRGRGRGGAESSRGGRGRGGSDRGRTASRGGRGGAVAAARTAAATASVPTTESTGWGEPNPVATTGAESAWDTPAAADSAAWGQSAATNDAWGAPASTDKAAASTEDKKSSVIPQGSKKSWASMLAPPKVAPAVPKVAVSAAPVKQPQPEIPITTDAPSNLAAGTDTAPIVLPPEETEDANLAAQTGLYQRMPSGTNSIDLTPPKDRLTEDNLEALPDASVPPATDTVASTRDAASAVGSNTPSFAAQQAAQPIGRPPVGGYATTAWRATGTPGRSVSYQRRLLEQQEAVVMPGNHAVDRAAVQFGSMGLDDDTKPADFDDDREDTETRAQPPQQSPAQPRASLPPAPQQQTAPPEAALHDGAPTPKQAPGLPPPMGQQQQIAGQSYGQYGRYAPGLGQDQTGPAQKPYDPFSGQLSYPQGQGEQNLYPGQSQPPTSAAPTSLAGADYNTSQYGGQDQRGAYNNYYGGSYGQQDQAQPPQRSTSGLGAADSGYGTQQSQSRFGEAQGSGNNTPAPSTSAQQGMGHQQPPQGAGQHGQGYGYGNPYYGSSYYGNYMNQVRGSQPLTRSTRTEALTRTQYPAQYGGYNQQGYGGPYGGGKGNISHQGFGMPPQGSHEYSSSPANAGGFGQNAAQGGRDSAFGSGLNDQYTRTGSAQASQAPSQPAGFGGATDAYGRSPSGFGSHGQYGQASSAAADESIKALDSKTGPSPALGQPGRTGSAMNSSAQGSQSGYAPPGGQGFGGGYQNHLNHLGYNQYGSQHGGLGGLGAQHSGSSQSHQSGSFSGGGYGGYNSQYGSYGRGGWGGNYGH
ncbi:hypothetical protein FH972_022012 [Carpinus fangiana]|uniref:RNA polymerase II degradation factor 1 n=1 Tax=Carpinus fangiana TaxID=176857 RepID=A0A5N6KR02_9ROSI|nr:hypothetical protein FH972_022012 [Carpinus fangiana]